MEKNIKIELVKELLSANKKGSESKQILIKDDTGEKENPITFEQLLELGDGLSEKLIDRYFFKVIEYCRKNEMFDEEKFRLLFDKMDKRIGNKWITIFIKEFNNHKKDYLYKNGKTMYLFEIINSELTKNFNVNTIEQAEMIVPFEEENIKNVLTNISNKYLELEKKPDKKLLVLYSYLWINLFVAINYTGVDNRKTFLLIDKVFMEFYANLKNEQYLDYHTTIVAKSLENQEFRKIYRDISSLYFMTNENLQNAIKENSEFKEQIQQLEETIVKKNAHIDRLSTNLNEMSESYALCQSKNVEQQSVIDELQDEISKLNGKLKSNDKLYEQDLASTEESIIEKMKNRVLIPLEDIEKIISSIDEDKKAKIQKRIDKITKYLNKF